MVDILGVVLTDEERAVLKAMAELLRQRGHHPCLPAVVSRQAFGDALPVHLTPTRLALRSLSADGFHGGWVADDSGSQGFTYKLTGLGVQQLTKAFPPC